LLLTNGALAPPSARVDPKCIYINIFVYKEDVDRESAMFEFHEFKAGATVLYICIYIYAYIYIGI